MKKNLLGLILSIFILFIPTVVFADSTSDRIHFVSTNGESMIIESNGHYGLVDASDGTNAASVKSYAQALGVTHFDFVIMTHNHEDNIGGIPVLADLFDSNTLVFYKEDLVSRDSNDQVDDYEEVSGLNNHTNYEAALQTFTTKNSKTCDVTKSKLISNVACDLNSLNNTFIPNVVFEENDGVSDGTDVKEYLAFDFGDFEIRLYSLYTLSYHIENLNSIVTVVKQKDTGAKAVLTADVETAVGDDDYASVLTGRSNLISDPTHECDPSDLICINSGIENQIADVIGEVHLLKVANHGNDTSNTLDILDIYKPRYYIQADGNVNNAVEFAFGYLKNANGTKSYTVTQSQGALVAEFNSSANALHLIEIKDFNSSAIDTEIAPTDMGTSNFTNGWKQMHNTGLDDIVKGYVENGQFVKGTWKDIAVNSTTYTFHFEDSTLMTTGFYAESDDSEEPDTPDDPADPDEDDDEEGGEEPVVNAKTFYFCESDTRPSCVLGAMQTGFVNIKAIDMYNPYDADGYYKYYFRTVADEISTGDKGEMVKGLATIGGDTYYFRTAPNEVFDGPDGSALVNGCVLTDPDDASSRKCFDGNGVLTTSNVPTPIPTDSLCSGAFYLIEESETTPGTYVGVSQSIVKDPIGGYTWSNNEHVNVGQYTVTATLEPNYYWDHGDNTTGDTDPKTITCSIIKYAVVEPIISEDEFLYDGDVKSPTFIYESAEEAVVFSGTESATAAGTYTIYANLRDTNNMEWADGTPATTAKEYTWEIKSAQWPAPTATSRTYSYDGTPKSIDVSSSGGVLEYSLDGTNWSETKPTITTVDQSPLTIQVRVKGDASHTTSLPSSATITLTKRGLTKPTIPYNAKAYTGSEISIIDELTAGGYNNSTMNVSGTTGATNVGQYTVTVVIRDQVNNEWSDNTSTGVILNWSITKAPQDAPNVASFNGEYDGQPHSVTATGTGTVEYSLDNNAWSTTNPTSTAVGVTTVYVRMQEDANHLASPVEVALINITKKHISKPSVGTNSFTYTGSEITPTITGFDADTMTKTGDLNATNVGNYALYVALKSNNYIWSDDTTTDLEFAWEITPADLVAPSVANYNGTYDGQPHSVTVTGTGTIKYSTNGTTWEDTLPTMIDAGSMTVYVKALGDSNHNDSAVVSGEVNISKANLNAPAVTNYSGYYDGQPHTITVATVSVGTIKYSTDGATWTTTKPTRTDVGKTTMYVMVAGNNNYNDSSSVVGSIEILDNSTYEIKNYTVDETNRYINKIIVGTDLDTFKSNIVLGYGYSVTVDTKTVNGKKLLYTGGKTRIFNGSTLVKEYTNIVIGDTNGDGLANSADILRLRQHLLGTKLITGVYFIASDINYDNTINSADLLRERQHILGTKVIN